jgi:hypothetical protein
MEFEVLATVIMNVDIFWDTVPFVCEPMFRRNVSAPCSRLKICPTINQYARAGGQDRGDMLLRNVGLYMDYTALYPRG